MYWFISASVGIAAKTMASRRHGFDILTGPEILHLFHMAMFRPGCFKLELRELRSVVYHPPVSNCRSSQIRSCPCSIFSGVSASLVRKRDTSPEIISDLDGRSLFKVHILTTVSQQVSGLSPARTDAPQRVRLCRLAAVSKCVSI